MEGFFWALKTHIGFNIIFPFIISFLIAYVLFQSDFIFLLVVWFSKLTFGKADSFVSGNKLCPDGLVIIPSLLRNKDDYDAIVMSANSCVINDYPSRLVIVISIDGYEEFPNLYNKLISWSKNTSHPSNVYLYVTGTPDRRSKMMAIDAGCEYMKSLVANGEHKTFPTIYFSLDGDGVLSSNALERMAIRLNKPHFFTGNLRRVVSGKIYIRKDLIWNGWKNFFTVGGQIHSQVAREFITVGVGRYNCRIFPKIGLAGALYCTWSEMLIQAPKYMGFLQSITFMDYIKWIFGCGAPLFSESKSLPLPEALTGGTDDTTMSFIAMISSWKNGALSFDAPQTPLHSVGRWLKELLIERSHDYEPEARIYTFTPSTITGLWNQRVRWNGARFECSFRLIKALFFHYDIGFAALWSITTVLRMVISNLLIWIILPFLIFGGSNITVLIFFGYLFQVTSTTLYFLMSLALEREYKDYWKSIISIIFIPIYTLFASALPTVYGNVRDILFFGNSIRFVPEKTLIKGKSERIALLYRIRRFALLCIRSVIHGNVPLGTWWFGFREHYPYVDSGYKGWTSGKRSRYILK